MRITRRGIHISLPRILVVACAAATAAAMPAAAEHVLVANRGSGTVSVIDDRTDTVIRTVSLPAGPNNPEPMYVVHVPAHKRVFVGDRANSRIAVYRTTTGAFETTVPVGNGVFHMWADGQGKELWVVCDVDRTATVIDARTLGIVATVPMPADLVALGGRPHDVVLDDKGEQAYVSIITVAGPNDFLVRFDVASKLETHRAAVGKDPHLSYNKRLNRIYSPCQNGNAVFVLEDDDLALVTTIPVAAAHGATTSADSRRFYTTNIAGGGVNAVFAIDPQANAVNGAPANAPATTPHNVVLSTNQRKLYLTHSGANNTVSVYRATADSPVPVFLKTITVGSNPFGLTAVP